MEDLLFQPVPVQPGGVPIWVGGGWPGVKPLRRASSQAGFMPYHPSGDDPFVDADDIFGPDDVRQMRSQLLELRGDLDGFDIVIGGQRRRPDREAERDHIAAIADAGATWWCEWIPPGTPDQLRRAVAHGPLR